MELTRKEDYKNKKISVGITVLSFLIMVLFLIFKNIITSNPTAVNEIPNEVSIGMESGPDNNFNENKKSPTPLFTKENQSPQQKIVTSPNSDAPVESTATEIADHYTITNNNPTTATTENNTPAITEGPTERTSGDSKFGYDLKNRVIFTRPKFTSNTKEEGKVVVDITVDKTGTVVEADANGRGTTTNSAVLKAKAKEMASAIKFNPDARMEEQRGTITIIFSFN